MQIDPAAALSTLGAGVKQVLPGIVHTGGQAQRITGSTLAWGRYVLLGSTDVLSADTGRAARTTIATSLHGR